MEKERFDLCIIGAGPGGYVAAIRAAQRGLRVALVEEGDVGGTCLNRGCIPTKTLIHASHLYRDLTQGADFGIEARELRYDLPAMYRRKDAVVSELRDGVSSLLDANGVTCFTGRGFIAAPGLVRVTGLDETEISAARILIATGAGPVRPAIPGSDLEGVITSDELLGQQPLDSRRLCVVGGGVIGCEIASIYNALGCEVTIIESAQRLLPTADREIGQNLAMILKKRGVQIHVGANVEEIARAHSGSGLSVRYLGKQGEALLDCDHVLLSVGRRALVEGLWDESLPIKLSRGGIVVNDHFETSVPDIYAIGDCLSLAIQLAHVATAQASNVVSRMLGEPAEVDISLVPGCIYTDPEIAWVGLSADEAKQQGRAVKTSKYVMSGNGKSIIERQDRGFIKLVFDAETEVLLGAQLMCGRATDLLGEVTLAISKGASATELAAIIRPHPTFGEGLGEAVEDLFSRAVHVAPKRKPPNRGAD